jgi:hypothetical protein
MRRLVLAVALGSLAACVTVIAVSTACADTPVEDATTFKNVKILTDVKSKTEMRRIMKEQAASLGVKCSYCHVPGKFELDDKKEKVVARKMMEMVKTLNATTFSDAPEDEKPAITCWTCHRGAEEPESHIPPEALAAIDEQK